MEKVKLLHTVRLKRWTLKTRSSGNEPSKGRELHRRPNSSRVCTILDTVTKGGQGGVQNAWPRWRGEAFTAFTLVLTAKCDHSQLVWLAKAPGSTGRWLNSSITGGLIEDDCSVASVEMGSM